MGSVFFSVPMVITPSLCSTKIDIGYVNNPHLGMGTVVGLSCNSQLPFPRKCRIRCSRISRILSLSHGQTTGEGNSEEEEDESVDELRVPNHWLHPSKALEVNIYYIFFLLFGWGLNYFYKSDHCLDFLFCVMIRSFSFFFLNTNSL